MRTLMTGAVVVSLLGLAACGGDDAEPPAHAGLPDSLQVADRYHQRLHVDLDSMTMRYNGLYVQDVEVGEGARADSGDVVTVHYTGRLPNGNEFDSSRERDQPFQVALGYGRVIQGWDQGIVGMREGGRRRLVIPPGLAYGRSGQGPIPSNATLVFDVELLEVENRVPEGGPGTDAAGD